MEQPGERPNNKEKLRLFIDALDEKSRKIFWYFRCHRHGSIAELTNITGASNNMEVLSRLREVINPIAVRVFGQPLVEFCKSRIDPITGKKVLFHWWLLDFAEDNQLPAGVEGKPLVDFFDEHDQIVIIAEVSPTMTISEHVKAELRQGILCIRLDKLRQNPGGKGSGYGN